MKFFKLLIILSTVFLCSCTPESNTADNSKLNITATIFPQYDFAHQVGKDNVNLNMLLPPGAESHTYEPTPKDILTIQNSDIFIYTGGESDTWIKDILSTIDTKDKKIISLVDICNTYNKEIKEGMQHDEHDHHDHDNKTDEHVWTSPENAVLITNAIADAICGLDPENEEIYRKNQKEYTDKLTSLDKKIEDIVNNSKRKTLIFADRFPFRYFVERYGLDYYAAFPGCAEQTEPSVATVSGLIEKVKEENIPVIFYIEFSNHKLADTISEETGAKTAMFHSCHNVTVEEFKNGTSYYDLMSKNAEVLKEALN